MVGYEAGAPLASACRHGFEPVGQLRVWIDDRVREVASDRGAACREALPSREDEGMTDTIDVPSSQDELIDELRAWLEENWDPELTVARVVAAAR